MRHPAVTATRLLTAPLLPLLLLLLLLSGCSPVKGSDLDLYAVLGITTGPDTPDSEIKSKYKKLSRQLHPDMNRDGSEADRQRYQDVQAAYAVLSDRKRRKVYDMMGHEGLKQLEQQSQGRQRRDPFASLFGGGFGGHDGPDRGPDITMTIRVTLDDVYNGAEHTVPLTKQKLKSFDAVKKCMKCKAQPPKLQKVQIGPGMVMQQEVPPDCRRPCSSGGAVQRKQVDMEVSIEAGVPEGYEMKYELEADEFPDKLPGDVKFIVETAPHKMFRRQGEDLHMVLKITLLEALIGFEKVFRHMDDHEFTVSRSTPTHHGFTMNLEGEGMPKHHVPSERGNLVITFEVIFPKKVTPEQAEKFKEILA